MERAPKAYRNEAFLKSPPARPLRILAEYLEPEDRLAREGVPATVVFFGSARITPPEEARRALAALEAREPPATEAELTRARNRLKLAPYYKAARELASRLAKLGMALEPPYRFCIATGGGPGIMEAANRGAAEAGARTLGFNISLPHEQAPNEFLSAQLNFEFHYFFMRKLWFAYPCKALVIFPGGFGTLDELFEMLTLMQTGKSPALPVVLFGTSYWEEILNLEGLARWSTIDPEDLELLHRCDDVDCAYDYLEGRLRPEEEAP